MFPFGQTILLWRLDRGLTQSQVAERARIPRPNLSAIESGRREVSLKTIRALAMALGVNPGLLVDGIPPKKEIAGYPFTREKMERIAKAVTEGATLPDSEEQFISEQISQIVQSRLRLVRPSRTHGGRVGRKSDRAWLFLSQLPPSLLHSLMDRIVERAKTL